MKLEKFPDRVQDTIENFDSLENKKRFRILLTFSNGRTLVASRLEYNEVTGETFIKYSAQSKRSFKVKPELVAKLSEIRIEKTNVIRKKLGLRSPLKRRIERDELGIPVKKPKKIRMNREFSELEFKSLFDDRFITDEKRDELFGLKNLMGRMDIPKKAFKTIKPEFQDVVDEFLEKFENIETVNEHYKRNNYGSLSLIVGKTFHNERQLDPRFKTYKSFTIIHRQRDPFVKVIKNSVKGGVDTIYYLINPTTMVQVSKNTRYRNRG